MRTRIALMLSAATLATATLSGVPAGASDTGGRLTNVDGDAFADLLIGAPGEDVSGNEHAGAVFVTMGRAGGLAVGTTLMLTQDTPGLRGAAEPHDRFGAAVVSGDFNGDTFSDIAIGIPGEAVDGHSAAGAVQIVYGGPGGPSLSDLVFTQSNLGIGDAGAGDRFGGVLTVGNFDSDAYDDLAIGAPGENVTGSVGAGEVDVLYGSASGITGTYVQKFTLSVPGLPGTPQRGDRFGAALAAASFDGVGPQDLVIGVPGKNVGGVRDAGMVIVLQSDSWGLVAVGAQIWHRETPGIVGSPGRGDRFGSALAAYAWGADGRGDLAVGVPGEDVDGARDAGAVHVIEGTAAGLSSDFDFLLHEDTNGVPRASSAGDRFGSVLGVGGLAGDGREDLIVGVPDETVAGVEAAGVVYAIPTYYNSPTGYGTALLYRGNGLPGIPQAGDRFGASVAAGGFDANGYDDLVVGVPGDRVGGVPRAGSVEVVWGGGLGLGGYGRLLLSESTGGVPSGPSAHDGFGAETTG